MPKKLGSKRYGSGANTMRPRWHFFNVFRNMDNFGKEVPAFNINGQTKVNTVVGGIISTCILTLVFIYAGIKFDHLVNRENPNIIETDIEDYYTIEEVLNLT